MAIARAIAKRPDVLLCDEPTGALDFATGKLVLEVIERINRELGTRPRVITHNAAIAQMADRVVTLADGRIAERRAASRSARARASSPGRRPCCSPRSTASWCASVAQLKGQVATIALVLASGITCFIALRGTYASLEWSREAYYDRYRFATCSLTRRAGAGAVAQRIEALPGVALVQTRIAEEVTLPMPGLDRAGVRAPAVAARGGRARATRCTCAAGGCPMPTRDDEVAGAGGVRRGARPAARTTRCRR